MAGTSAGTCIEPGARLLFHAGHDRQRNVAAKPTNHMLAAYKPSLRQYLVSNHYMDTLAFHTMSGQELISKFAPLSKDFLDTHR